MPLSFPVKISVPFATSGQKNTIPASSDLVNGKAGYDQGFPPINMTPKTAGGIPPFGQDFNGIFYDVTTAIRFIEAGGQFPYDAAFATAVGGYPIGALVCRSDYTGLWRNVTDGNTSDPEASGSTGWRPEDAGSFSLTMSNANVTLTNLQASRSLIFIFGTLTANLQLIFPTYGKQWTVVNKATGNFTVTLKTAAGSGVALATGMSQVVAGDGANILSVASGRLLNIQTFATAGSFTYTPTPGTNAVMVECVGGGGSGGGFAATGSGQAACSTGGSGGGYSRKYYATGFSGVTVTVGAGGAALTGTTTTQGNPGGTTTFGGSQSATGGSGGASIAPLSTFPAFCGTNPPGGGIGGDLNLDGGWAQPSMVYTSTTLQQFVGSSGGWQGGGTRVTPDTAAIAGTKPGEGGSGVARSASLGALNGGAGFAGIVIIWEYA